MLTAILWDFDGTLADTRRQNLRITRRIVERVTNRTAEQFQALRSPANYASATTRSSNWRELYLSELGLTGSETDEAGRLWASYQMADETPPRFYEGIPAVLHCLSHVPHGIVSQNARSYIESALEHERLHGYFQSIIGYEEVDYSRQKPEPDGLLMCLEATTGLAPGIVLYVGDHEADARCAANANAALRARGAEITVLMIGALYGDGKNTSEWSPQPDHRAITPQDITAIARSLP